MLLFNKNVVNLRHAIQSKAPNLEAPLNHCIAQILANNINQYTFFCALHTINTLGNQDDISSLLNLVTHLILHHTDPTQLLQHLTRMSIKEFRRLSSGLITLKDQDTLTKGIEDRIKYPEQYNAYGRHIGGNYQFCT